MLTAFYIFVAVCVVFVILSLQVVRAHEKKVREKQAVIEAARTAGESPYVKPEEEFFTSPIYKAMEVIAHM